VTVETVRERQSSCSVGAVQMRLPGRTGQLGGSSLGVSLTHYRNRVRVAHALDRLEAGEPSLATLTADLGAVKSAHLHATHEDSPTANSPPALRTCVTPRTGLSSGTLFADRTAWAHWALLAGISLDAHAQDGQQHQCASRQSAEHREERYGEGAPSSSILW
jgi:hypothetical protein